MVHKIQKRKTKAADESGKREAKKRGKKAAQNTQADTSNEKGRVRTHTQGKEVAVAKMKPGRKRAAPKREAWATLENWPPHHRAG